MSLVNCQIRRANVEDLEKLRSLWKQAALPVGTLEKSLTEFQVAEAADGALLACIGLQLEAQQGKIHHASFSSPEMRVELERRLWERVQSVARNYGLWRLWTQDGSEFWREQGFQEADENVRKKLPPRFGHSEEIWLILKLREEIGSASSLENEVELFRRSQKDSSDRILRQVNVVRAVATVIGAILVVLAFWMVWYVIRRLPTLTKP